MTRHLTLRRQTQTLRCHGATALFLCLSTTAAMAVSPKISRIQSADAFLAGTLEDVAVDPMGVLTLAPRLERVATISEPFVLTAAARNDGGGDGWVLGTGNDGRVVSVSARGQIGVLHEVVGEQIFAVAVASDGAVWAGASPSGRVWRIADGEATLMATTGETYVWSIAPRADGGAWVATGTRGRLMRVDRSGNIATVWDGDDPHVRVVRSLPDGGAVVGTAGSGLVVRVDERGRPTTLFDAAQPEIVDLVLAPGGGYWVAAIASEASAVELRPANKPTTEATGEGEQVTVAAVAEGQGALGSRPPGFQGARSEVFHVGDRGAASLLGSFADDTVLALAESAGRLWIGTGLSGKVFSVREERRVVLEHDGEERQVVALLGRPDGPPSLVTTNAGSVARLRSDGERIGSYTTPVLDAGQVARVGVGRWRGAAPAGTTVVLAARSGLSSEPDAGWSPWTSARSGQEVDFSDVPEGRYLQLRAVLEGNGVSPTVGGLELSWQQLNQRPVIGTFEALAPGEILVPYGFTPGNQIWEAANPTKEGIFTTLVPASEPDDSRLKSLFKRGYQTFRWKASDPNGDELRARLEIRRDGSGGKWFTLVEDRLESHFGFDATVLPDGVWRVRLVVSDARASAVGEELEATAISEPLVLDQSVPVIGSVRREGTGLVVDVTDALNPLREAVYSLDASTWKPVLTRDGLVDGRRETIVIDNLPPSAELVLLRVTDAASNATVVDLAQELR